MTLDPSPIAAVATASGRGGIGVVRISGKNLWSVVQAVCGKDENALPPRHATYLPFKRADGSVIDRGLAIYFKAPHSYTGEDVLELQGHGGPVVMRMLLARCLEAGAGIGLRLAEPGEFTQRAFLNDKLDLAQAEAVADLIEASTEAAARSAAESLSGAFSRVIHDLVGKLTNLRMLVEATLDFPEEDIDFLEHSDARAQLFAIRAALEDVFTHASHSTLLRDGLHVVLAGKPNVGKSSLLNALAGSDVAIVTPIAGTTRDKIIETIQINGIPLDIIDTAGIRDVDAYGSGPDEVERIGIERTWGAVAQADVILHMLDADCGPTREDEKITGRFPADIPVIRIWNKIDRSGHKPAVDHLPDATHIYLSATSHIGIDLLRNELLRIAGGQQTLESPYLARERHLIALRDARDYLANAALHAEADKQTGDKSIDLFAEELRLAQERLSSITGKFTPDDLLGMIFSRFCIGK
ncbi:MAG: tRNA uridine-5-carboxymethylaminomethyl(34) synthesis GTPase MnmE [Herbaspirillum sp.]